MVVLVERRDVVQRVRPQVGENDVADLLGDKVGERGQVNGQDLGIVRYVPESVCGISWSCRAV
jgi:hypothetical protein